ncbi:MAG: thioredoxin domain-containing protein [Alphaproteobacteria bacterium]
MKRIVQAAAFASAFLMVACAQSAPPAPAAGDMALGPDNAKVTITEYAAPSCPICKKFHDEVYKGLKTKYIDTGKVRFVMKEMPSHNPPVDVAVFMLARCSGKAKYFAVMDAAYDKQSDIEIAASSPNGAKPALVDLAKSVGGLSEEQANACLTDQVAMKKILTAADEDGQTKNITGTPTIFLDDQRMGQEIFDLGAFSAAIDAKLAGK